MIHQFSLKSVLESWFGIFWKQFTFWKDALSSLSNVFKRKKWFTIFRKKGDVLTGLFFCDQNVLTTHPWGVFLSVLGSLCFHNHSLFKFLSFFQIPLLFPFPFVLVKTLMSQSPQSRGLWVLHFWREPHSKDLLTCWPLWPVAAFQTIIYGGHGGILFVGHALMLCFLRL